MFLQSQEIIQIVTSPFYQKSEANRDLSQLLLQKFNELIIVGDNINAISTNVLDHIINLVYLTDQPTY